MTQGEELRIPVGRELRASENESRNFQQSWLLSCLSADNESEGELPGATVDSSSAKNENRHLHRECGVAWRGVQAKLIPQPCQADVEFTFISCSTGGGRPASLARAEFPYFQPPTSRYRSLSSASSEASTSIRRRG